MKRNVRWMLPAVAAVGLLVGMASLSARAADEAKPAGKGNVSGTVVDKDGKAVAGVEVRLMKPMMRRGGPGGPPGGGAEGRKPADQATGGQHAIGLQEKGEKPAAPGGEGRPPRPEPVATAKTDDAGKFEMKDVPAGDYMVGVRDDDKKVYGGARVTVKDGETATAEIKTTDKPMFRGGPGGPGGGQGGRGGRRGGGQGGAGGGEQK